MVVLLAGGCRVSDMRDGEPVTHGTLRIWKQISRATGAQAIAMRIMEFAPGSSPEIKNENCDQILFVLENDVSTACGNGRLALRIEGKSHDVEPNSGIYVRPAQTFAIENPGPDSIIIVSCQCPDPDREPQFVQATFSTSPGNGQSPIVRLADRPPQSTADRSYRVLVDDEVGSFQATQFVGSIPPGRAPDHFHQYEEVLFILRGAGRMWAGETSTPIAAGTCVYLPKGQVHCVENTGTGELRLLGVFYPAGSPSVRYEA